MQTKRKHLRAALFRMCGVRSVWRFQMKERITVLARGVQPLLFFSRHQAATCVDPLNSVGQTPANTALEIDGWAHGAGGHSRSLRPTTGLHGGRMGRTHGPQVSGLLCRPGPPAAAQGHDCRVGFPAERNALFSNFRRTWRTESHVCSPSTRRGAIGIARCEESESVIHSRGRRLGGGWSDGGA